MFTFCFQWVIDYVGVNYQNKHPTRDTQDDEAMNCTMALACEHGHGYIL